jgi:hypothetical protein
LTQSFEDFRQEHPEAAKAMALLGMSWQSYEMAWRQLFEPPRISTGGSTIAIPFPTIIPCQEASTSNNKE